MIFTREFQTSIEQQKKNVGSCQQIISSTSDFQKFLNYEQEKFIMEILLLLQIKQNEPQKPDLEQPDLEQANQKQAYLKQAGSEVADSEQADLKQTDSKQAGSNSQEMQQPDRTDFQQCRSKYSQLYLKALQELQKIKKSARIEHQALVYQNRVDYLNKLKESSFEQHVKIKIQQQGRLNKVITEYIFNIKTYLNTLGKRIQVQELLQEEGEIQKYIQRQKQEFEKYRPQIQSLIEQREEKLKQTLQFVEGTFMDKNEQIESLEEQKRLLEQQLERQTSLIKQFQDKQTKLYSKISKIALQMVQNKISACSNSNYSRLSGLSQGEQMNYQNDDQTGHVQSRIFQAQDYGQISQLNNPIPDQISLQQITRQDEQNVKRNQLKCQIKTEIMQQLKKMTIPIVILGILTLVQLFW